MRPLATSLLQQPVLLFVVTKQPVVELRVIDDDDRLASVDWALKVKCVKAETAAEASSESVGCARCDSVIVACSDACRPADYDGMTIPPADRPTDRPTANRPTRSLQRPVSSNMCFFRVRLKTAGDRKRPRES